MENKFSGGSFTPHRQRQAWLPAQVSERVRGPALTPADPADPVESTAASVQRPVLQMEWLQAWGLFGLLVFAAAQNSTDRPDPRPSYLLLGPRSLRPGVPVAVSVTVLSASPVTVLAQIVHGNSSIASNSTTIDGGSTELLVLPPVLGSKSSYWRPYMLEVKGYVAGIEVFSNSTRLRFNPKGLSTFIQTDKLNYRPGQEVKIRAVSIHPDGKPQTSPADIIIKDPRGNMIRQWLNLDSVLGVVSKRLQLSENPPLGKWTIVTTVNGISSEKHFNVAHYELPKFKVVIEAPAVLYYEDSLHGSVTAKYVYGKPVQGRVNISFIHIFHGMRRVFHEDKMIDGTTDFTLDVPDFRDMKKRFAEFDDEYRSPQFLIIDANVTEYLTGLTYSSVTKVSLAGERYQVAFDDYSKILRPSLNFTAKLKISTFNNQPLSPEDQGKTVRVSVTQYKQIPWLVNWGISGGIVPRFSQMPGPSGFNFTPPEELPVEEVFLFPVPTDGVIPLFLQLLNETEILTIEASFEDSQKTLNLYSSYTSPSKSYLEIQRPISSPQVGLPLQLEIQSNFQLSDIHYMVKSRGQIISAGKSNLPLILVPDSSWAPEVCIVVYCVHSNGEVINDAIQLPITWLLQNQVSLSWSEADRKPAEPVSLRVSVAEPGSLVGILVVDKAARLNGSHNDITKETVLEEIAGYNRDKPIRQQMGDPYSIFMTCDLVVLTDTSLSVQRKNPMMPQPEFPGEGVQLLAMTAESDTEQQEEPRERWNFPETWLWLDTNTGNSSAAVMSLTVPDSITTWSATAFVVSESLGLGVVETPAELTVFQDFFLSLNLPAYIVRGEELVLEVLLFNYLPQDLEVMVIVAESDTFQFVFPDNEALSMASVRRLSVPSQGAASVLIPIKPLVLGEIPVSVKAVSSAASDAVRRAVLVKPEGVEQWFSTSLFLELAPPETSLSRDITFTFPADVVAGSERAHVTAVGDILAPSIAGLGSLVRMPYGCGEQNMINFAPNIYVLRYLTATGQADAATAERAKAFMVTGYERQLSFQRADGSFSAFGDSDPSGSSWLSAFVLRCFLQARSFVFIQQEVVQRAAAWLAAQQGADGSFEEPGRVIHTALQGGLDGPVALTAYVLIALLEDSSIKDRYASQVSEALMFLETRLALSISSNYSLSLLSYALALAGSSSANAAVSELIGRADVRDGVPFWSSLDAGLSASWQPRSADIEMASYVLLALHELGNITANLGLVKWLSRQRNDLGGYGSTQDTVVALQALSTAASIAQPPDLDLTITVSQNSSSSSSSSSFHIHWTNRLLQQNLQIDVEEELNLRLSAEGKGFALIQLNVFYNVDARRLSRRRRDAAEHEAFDLQVALSDTKMHSARLLICTRLLPASGLYATGMAVLEVGLLSGFGLAQDGVRTGDVIKRVETPPRKVVLYLDSVTREKMCVRLPLVMEHKVAKVQDAAVVIYDYYEPRRRTEKTYKSSWRRNMSSCSFCGDGCGQCRARDDFLYASGGPSQRHFLPSCLLSTLLLLLFTV
ncbi:CD109 antigen [Myripristis murdjan]|uniref:CD109 antigen n=1 Tax=Myripristis murdjan TaxID=586833 RepID=UPI0011761AAC|nr:CD109 antigen-like [Myripristis murdjan]